MSTTQQHQPNCNPRDAKRCPNGEKTPPPEKGVKGNTKPDYTTTTTASHAECKMLPHGPSVVWQGGASHRTGTRTSMQMESEHAKARATCNKTATSQEQRQNSSHKNGACKHARWSVNMQMLGLRAPRQQPPKSTGNSSYKNGTCSVNLQMLELCAPRLQPAKSNGKTLATKMEHAA